MLSSVSVLVGFLDEVGTLECSHPAVRAKNVNGNEMLRIKFAFDLGLSTPVVVA